MSHGTTMNETAQEEMLEWLGVQHVEDNSKSGMPCPFSVSHPPRKWFAAPPLWKVWATQNNQAGIGLEQHLFKQSSVVCNVDGVNSETKKGELGLRGYLRSHMQGPYMQVGLHGTHDTDGCTPPAAHLHLGNKWVTPTDSTLDARAFVQPFAGVDVTKDGKVTPSFGVSMGFEFS